MVDIDKCQNNFLLNQKGGQISGDNDKYQNIYLLNHLAMYAAEWHI